MHGLVVMAVFAGLAPWCPAQETSGGHFPPVAKILGLETIAPSSRPLDFNSALARLSSPKPEARKAAVIELGVPGEFRAVPYLSVLLRDGGEPLELRIASAMSLGKVGTWRAVPPLREALKAPERELRFAAALALGKTRAPEALAPLVDTLASDPDWWARFAAAVALGESRAPAAVKALGLAAEADAEWQVRMQAVRSLGQAGSRDAAYALARPLGDRDPAVRAAAALALGEIGGLDSLNLLTSALHAETDGFPRQVMADGIKKLLARVETPKP